MITFQTPIFENIMDQDFPHYPFKSTFDEVKEKTLLILHTSGTTGLPKPIMYTHEWAAAYMSSLKVEPQQSNGERDLKVFNMKGVRMLVMMPPYHAANIFCTTFIATALQTTIILPPADATPCVDVFLGAIQTFDIDSAFVPPHFIPKIAANDRRLQVVAKYLEVLISGGGRIPDASGDKLCSLVKLVTLYSATEVGSIPEVDCSHITRDLWNYVRPHASAKWEFRRCGVAGLENTYEAWISKDGSGSNQAVFKLFPSLTEYCTRDLFMPH
jgi:acyl-coenzyme A synthetase/AMP-(fatty) acid ligase